jgi:hypothetical protein
MSLSKSVTFNMTNNLQRTQYFLAGEEGSGAGEWTTLCTCFGKTREVRQTMKHYVLRTSDSLRNFYLNISPGKKLFDHYAIRIFFVSVIIPEIKVIYRT